MTEDFKGNLLAARSLLLSQRQDFLNNHPARVPITPNQQGLMEMRDEVLSSVGAQDMDTIGISCPICTISSFTDKILIRTWMQSSNQA